MMFHLFIKDKNELVGPRQVLKTGSFYEEGLWHLLKVLVLSTTGEVPAARFAFLLRVH